MSVSAENEIPYHLCKVVKRTTTGLWEVVKREETIEERERVIVSVTVEDVNEPPVFDKTNKWVTVAENIKKGYHLATFTAKDPDIKSANTFV